MKKSFVAVILVVAMGLGFVVGSWVTWRAVTASTKAVAERHVTRYICPMHPAILSDRPGDCPSCGMRLVPVDDEGDRPRAGATPSSAVRIDNAAEQVGGIVIGRVQRRALRHVLRNTGRVAADETRIYRINTSAGGWIKRTFPNSVGSLVQKGEVLATFYTREFQTAQQAYFYALDALDRFTAQNASESQLTGTRAQVQAAVDSLESLGMSSTQIAELAKSRKVSLEIELRSPINGFILERNVSPNQRFSSGDELYRIVDLSRVWVLADIYENERNYIRPRQEVTVVSDGKPFRARTSEVLPTFDASSRTLKLRLEMDNPGYRFRPDMFVDVNIPVDIPDALTVPSDALLDTGTRTVVFAEQAAGAYEPREVETGWRFGEYAQVLHGLSEGERIVVSGTFLVSSESRMKAAAIAAAAASKTIDPVCGMEVDTVKAKAAGRTIDHDHRTYYFCADDCKKQFAANPEKFERR